MKLNAKNSIYGYIIGDILGVPYEFETQGEFSCLDYASGGAHNMARGTWSDDTSILLCLLDSLTDYKSIDTSLVKYEANLKSWFFQNKFTADNDCFDIGNQTMDAILANFNQPPSDRMGNGALFCSLPLALFLLNENCEENRRQIVGEFCRVTHNNGNSKEYAFRFEELLRTLFLGEKPNLERTHYENRADVINTYFFVCDQFSALVDQTELSLFNKLCKVVDLGNDTDTNAAFVGALLGAAGDEASNHDMEIILNLPFIENIINNFFVSLEQNT